MNCFGFVLVFLRLLFFFPLKIPQNVISHEIVEFVFCPLSAPKPFSSKSIFIFFVCFFFFCFCFCFFVFFFFFFFFFSLLSPFFPSSFNFPLFVSNPFSSNSYFCLSQSVFLLLLFACLSSPLLHSKCIGQTFPVSSSSCYCFSFFFGGGGSCLVFVWLLAVCFETEVMSCNTTFWVDISFSEMPNVSDFKLSLVCFLWFGFPCFRCSWFCFCCCCCCFLLLLLLLLLLVICSCCCCCCYCCCLFCVAVIVVVCFALLLLLLMCCSLFLGIIMLLNLEEQNWKKLSQQIAK